MDNINLEGIGSYDDGDEPEETDSDVNKDEGDLLIDDEELDDEGSPRKKLSHISSP